MPQGRKKVPFSGKAKKEQLKLKREKKATVPIVGETNYDQPGPSRILNVNAQPSQFAKAKSSRYALQFLQEKEEDIQRKKEEAHCVLAPIQEYLEVGAEYFPKEIQFPKRPLWSYDLTPHELELNEQKCFREYIANLLKLSSDLSFFELNIETWRQLWRVLEKSDVILLIVDVRFPSLMFPPSLYYYVTRVLQKTMILALNKVDLVPPSVVVAWSNYFRKEYEFIRVIFFTSLPLYNLRNPSKQSKLNIVRRKGTMKMAAEGAQALLDVCQDIVQNKVDLRSWQKKIFEGNNKDNGDGGGEVCHVENEEYEESDEHEESDEQEESDKHGESEEQEKPVEYKESVQHEEHKQHPCCNEELEQHPCCSEEHEEHGQTAEYELNEEHKECGQTAEHELHEDHEQHRQHDPRIVQREEELRPFTSTKPPSLSPNETLSIGCVGYPNSGKSSILNALMGKKVVSVSKTPGHTKHFQTIYLTPNVILCDCPGLVFPSFVPRHLQVLMGSFPIAQLREPYSSIRFLAEHVNLPKLLSLQHPDGEDTWTPIDICIAWALKRGFLTARTARPDTYRAANHILRMALEGKIIVWTCPPQYVMDKDFWDNHSEIPSVLHVQGTNST